MTTTGGKIIRGAAVVSACKLLGKVFGFGQNLVFASCFGTGGEADAFFLAFKGIISGLINIPQQILQPFLPLFVDKKEREGEPAAWRFAVTTTGCLVLLLAALTLVGWVTAPYLVHAIQRFPDEQLETLTTQLVRWMLPAAIFAGLFSLFYLLLNSFKKFAIPALGDVVNKVLIIAVMLILYRVLGIRAMAIGIVAGALACLAFQVAGLWDKRMFFRSRPDWKDPTLRKLGILILPLLVGTVLSQCRAIADAYFASGMGQGCLSSLNYARGVIDTLTLLVPYAIGVAMYPFFSDYAARQDWNGLSDSLLTVLRIIVFIFLPITVGMIVLRQPLVQLLFERGKFGPDSVALTTGPLSCYSLGLTAFALEIILMTFFFALRDTLTPILIGIITLVVHVALILGLIETLGHNSIALALALSRTLKVILLLILLKYKHLNLKWGLQVRFFGKVALCAAVMGLATYFTRVLVTDYCPSITAITRWQRPLQAGVTLGVAGAVGLAVYAGCSRLCRLEEIQLILRRYRRGNTLAHTS